MSGVWASTWPSGIKRSDGERGNVSQLGGEPPCRLVKDVREEEHEEKSTKTVSIKLSDSSKDTYPKFTGGSPEEAFQHIQLFYDLCEKMQFVKHYKQSAKLKAEYKTLLEDVPSAPDANADDDASDVEDPHFERRETLMAKRDECIEHMRQVKA